MKNVFYISIGSNINKKENIKKSAKLLEQEFKKISFSGVFETKPVGYLNQENFYNLTCRAESNKPMTEIKIFLKEIEKKLKRQKGKIKSGPRTIDLDILIWNKKTVNESATEEYNLPGLKEVLIKGEASEKIFKLVLGQKAKKPVFFW